jgi:hypothetical protein
MHDSFDKFGLNEEDDGKPYQSMDDWYQEVRHLKWPMIIFLIALLLLLVIIQYF